jgi:hypothetical protein
VTLDGDGPSLEILVLGPVVLRRNGVELPPPTRKPAEMLRALALAPIGAYVTTTELGQQLSRGPVRDTRADNAIQQHIRALRNTHQVPIETGERGTRGYRLIRDMCRVDAWEFVAAADSAGIEELLGMWRDGVPALDGRQWERVRAARSRLIQRISELPQPTRSTLADLDRFTSLFPDDQEVDKIRGQGRGSRPRLLVVDDDPDMLKEICERLDPYYECVPLTDIKEWREFRNKRDNLHRIHGALVDLHLTESLADSRGLEIVNYLKDKTKLPVALVTANPPERNAYGSEKNRKEFRLVDIVDKKQLDWWRALERAAKLLVGQGEEESRHRLETYLEHAYRAMQRANADAPPGSVAARRMDQCRRSYGEVLRVVKVEPLEVAKKQVSIFCEQWQP